MISWFERHNKISWIITILIGIFIFYISSLEFGTGSGSGSSVNAILYHIIVFFFFGAFLSISIVKGKHWKLIWFSILLAVLYGISDEWHQSFVPGRHAGVFDVMLDSFGVLIANLVYFLVRYRK